MIRRAISEGGKISYERQMDQEIPGTPRICINASCLYSLRRASTYSRPAHRRSSGTANHGTRADPSADSCATHYSTNGRGNRSSNKATDRGADSGARIYWLEIQRAELRLHGC